MKAPKCTALACLLSLPALSEVPTTLLWGDTHNHTSNSFDVYLFGTPNATTETAYRFARGLPVINPTTGTRWQIEQPLDFLVIADRAGMIGGMPRLFEERDPELATTRTGKAMLELAPNKTEKGLQEVGAGVQFSNLVHDGGRSPKGPSRAPAWGRVKHSAKATRYSARIGQTEEWVGIELLVPGFEGERQQSTRPAIQVPTAAWNKECQRVTAL